MIAVQIIKVCLVIVGDQGPPSAQSTQETRRRIDRPNGAVSGIILDSSAAWLIETAEFHREATAKGNRKAIRAWHWARR